MTSERNGFGRMLCVKDFYDYFNTIAPFDRQESWIIAAYWWEIRSSGWIRSPLLSI